MAPASAFAHEQTTTSNGVALTWSTATLPYDVHFDLSDPSGLALARSTRAAFDTWAYAAQGALQPEYRGPTSASRPGDRLSTVTVDASWDPAFGDPERAVAFAWVQYDPASGRIHEGDVHLNGARFTFASATPGAFDPESVILHELGHVLGLAHSCGDPGRTYPSCFSVPEEVRDEVLGAVMAPTLAPGSARRSLGSDDRAGLAVHWAGTALGRPRIQAVTATCGVERWTVTLLAPAAGAVVLRGADGVRTRPAFEAAGSTLSFEPPPGFEGDVVVWDEAQGVYDAWLDPVAAPECPGPGVDGGASGRGKTPGGCSCIVDPPTGRAVGWVSILGVIVMWTRRRARRTAAWALWVGLLVPAEGWAFECSRTQMTVGPSLIWTTREVPWFVGPGVFALVGDEAKGREDVLASFAAWEDVSCSDLTLPFQGEAAVVAGFDEGGNNTNAVVVVDKLWPYQSGAIAVTTSAYDTRNGHVVDSDIEINAQAFRFARVEDVECRAGSSTMDLRNTLTHEVGHVVGLEHPPNTARYAEVTMFASAPACETKKRSLASDDMDGLCFIYPAGEPTQQCYPPDGPSFAVVAQDDGFGGCTSAPGELLGLGWLLAGLFAWARRRRA